MKREQQQRAAEQESQEVENPEQVPEMQAEGEFTGEGEVPAVALGDEAEAKEAAPTASDLAFEQEEKAEEPKEENPEAKLLEQAESYNEDHPQRVAEFNQLTEDSCVHKGKLDLEKVREFQRAHKLDDDGKVGVWTIAAAKRVAEIRIANEAEKKAQDDKLAAMNKPAPVAVKEEAPKTAAVAQTEVKPEAVAKAEDPKVQGEKAAEAAQDTTKAEPAVQYNNAHAEQVAEFNDITSYAHTTAGQVDIEKVIAFQRAHGLTPDGRIGKDTIEAAKKAAAPVSVAEVENAGGEEEVQAMA
ncbi:MAG: peptidoglycan-binding protein [Kofleriaceae bacterium]